MLWRVQKRVNTLASVCFRCRSRSHTANVKRPKQTFVQLSTNQKQRRVSFLSGQQSWKATRRVIRRILTVKTSAGVVLCSLGPRGGDSNTASLCARPPCSRSPSSSPSFVRVSCSPGPTSEATNTLIATAGQSPPPLSSLVWNKLLTLT